MSGEEPSKKEKHFVMVVDLRKCIGCHACTAVCRVENNVPEAKFRTWIEESVVGEFPDVARYFLARLCNHCDRPPCTNVCPVKATYKREDGIVVIERDKKNGLLLLFHINQDSGVSPTWQMSGGSRNLKKPTLSN